MNRRAFSLLEVLLALALLAALSGGIFGFLWNLLDRRDALLRTTAQAQMAGACFEMLESDIACAIAGDGTRAGIEGSHERLRILSRRVWAPGAPSERAAAAGDLQESQYTYSRTTGEVRLKRSASRGGEGAWEDAIGEQIAALRFRYFDGRAWAASFDSAQARGLPVAVEVAVWFGEPIPPEDDPFSVPASERGSEPEDNEPLTLPDITAGPAPLVAAGTDGFPRRSPDRLRIISIADGPTTWWKEGGG